MAQKSVKRKLMDDDPSVSNITKKGRPVSLTVKPLAKGKGIMVKRITQINNLKAKGQKLKGRSSNNNAVPEQIASNGNLQKNNRVVIRSNRTKDRSKTVINPIIQKRSMKLKEKEDHESSLIQSQDE